MSGIITGGLGKNQTIITRGYGYSKWKIEKLYPKYIIELCPHCEGGLKNHIYYSRDPFTGEKIHKCKHCYNIIKWENGKWSKVLQWYEDSW